MTHYRMGEVLDLASFLRSVRINVLLQTVLFSSPTWLSKSLLSIVKESRRLGKVEKGGLKMSKIPNSNNSTNDQPPSTPCWVQIFGIISVVLILLVIIIMLFSGGNHGPGRHTLEGETTEQSVSVPKGQKTIQNREKEIDNYDGDHKSLGGDH